LRQGTTRRWASGDARQVGTVPLGPIAIATGVFLAVLVAFLAVTVYAIQATYAGRMYPGVHALGVSIGGQTRAEAQETLERHAAEMTGRSIVIGHQELNWTIRGEHLGVRPDVGPVLEEAYTLGREGNLLARFFLQLALAVNGSAFEVRAPAYDMATFTAFMQALAGAVDRPTRDAALGIQPEGTVAFSEGLTGRRLLVEPTRRRLEEAIARPEVEYVGLVVEETPPRVSSQDLEVARARAETVLSGPILLKFEEAQWQLQPRELAAMVEITSDHDVRLKQDAVKTWAANLAKQVSQAPQNARFTWDGELSLLRPSKDGRDLDVDRTVELTMARAFTTDRTIALPVSVTKPDVSEEDGPKLAIKGAIEVSRTSFAGSSPPKQHNIKLATQRLNGVVIPPGKMFSFNREVGSTSLDAGFQLGWGIANAGANVKTVPSVAGGICQVATTLFHSVFWAGYQIEERNYHLYWIPGYTSKGVEGLDATVDEEAGLDFRFYNNTDNYLLIQAWVENSRTVFGLYGTKPDWTVKVTPGERTDIVDASTDKIVEEEPSLPAGHRLAVEGAMDGFKVTNVRTVTRGSDVRPLRLTSSYRPSRNVTLVGTGGRPAGPSQTTSNRATRPAEAAPAARPSATSAPTAAPASKPTSPPAPTAAPTIAPASKPTAAPAPAAVPATAPAPAIAPAPAGKPVIQPSVPAPFKPQAPGPPSRTS
jgi:vancomycin resistance protein YoaR